MIEHFFARTAHKPMRSYLRVPIILGATAVQADFVDDGGVYYVHPAAIRTQGLIEPDLCKQVTEDVYSERRRRFSLHRGDIVLNRSGEGTIGKVGLFDSSERALFSDFTMRIRLSNNLDAEFAWYYMRSVLFQAQVRREKRGMGNMTNIFPDQVQRMLIVECAKEKQQEIAAEVRRKLRGVEEAKLRIEGHFRAIEQLILGAVSEGRVDAEM